MSWERGVGRGALGTPAPRAALQPAASLPGERTDPASFCLPRWGLGHPCCQHVPRAGQGSPPPPHHLLLPMSLQGAELSGSCPHPGTCAPLTIPKRLPWASSAQGAPGHSHGPRSPLCPPHSSSRTMLGEGRGALHPDPPGCLPPWASVSAGARWQARLLEFDFQINHKPG